MADAKKLIAESGPIDDILEALNGLLLMPANEFTEEAQVLIGETYEKAGKGPRALAEYKLFLTQFPNSPLFKNVQQRVITIEIALPAPKAVVGRPNEREHRVGSDSKRSMSVSEYLYMSSSVDAERPLKWKTDDVEVMSNFRGMFQVRDDDIITKWQLRYSRSDNFMGHEPRVNLSMATYEQQDTYLNYAFKIGRQQGLHGVLGRFDGVSSSYTTDSDVKYTFAYGVPFIGQSSSQRVFTGSSVTVGDNSYSLSGYVNLQQADGIPERKALGLEYHWGNASGSNVNAMAEYDLLYRSVNFISAQGVLVFGAWSPYFLVDQRKSPVLFAERAVTLGFGGVQRTPYTSVSDTFKNSGLTTEQIYTYISQSTPVAKSLVGGTSYVMSPTVTLAADFQVSNISAVTVNLPTIDLPVGVASQAGSGMMRSMNLMAYGTDVIRPKNSLTGIVSMSRDGMGRGTSLTAVDGFTKGNIRYEASARWYQRTQPTMSFGSISASLRANIRLSEDSGIDAAVTASRSHTTATGMLTTTTWSKNFYVGYRKDF